VLAGVGIGVAVITATLIAVAMQRATAPTARPRAISELAALLGMSASQARERAGESAGEGDYRAAIRYRCLAVLLTLDEAGMLAFDRSATDREYLYRAPGDLQDDLQPLLSRFEAVWYGHAPTGEAEWQEYAARAEEIERKVLAAPRVGRAACVWSLVARP